MSIHQVVVAAAVECTCHNFEFISFVGGVGAVNNDKFSRHVQHCVLVAALVEEVNDK